MHRMIVSFNWRLGVIFLACGLVSAAAQAQTQRTISGTTSTTAAPTATSREVIEDRLVQLALDRSYINKATVYESQMAEAEVRQAKLLWLDKIHIQANLNEFTIQPDKFVRSTFFPRYNFVLCVEIDSSY